MDFLADTQGCCNDKNDSSFFVGYDIDDFSRLVSLDG